MPRYLGIVFEVFVLKLHIQEVKQFLLISNFIMFIYKYIPKAAYTVKHVFWHCKATGLYKAKRHVLRFFFVYATITQGVVRSFCIKHVWI